ncbi:Der GTPase-activating protein YihI [Celerinatantimonas yamalensis]|uniref:Der GTPase-activating protein YihI n=1 Tax=Celerinatantimonas yamalensis TaxID=559956 RepID=A0ABW9G8N3_9GAMM
MANKKKNRKGGLLAPRKTADFKSERELPTDKVTKGKGHKSGSRQQVAESTVAKSTSKPASGDRRVGSKKPVQLVAAGTLAKSADKVVKAKVKKTVVPAVPVESKQDELARLEQDARLIALLDRSDEGEQLADADQQWLDNCLDRISVLMDELGINDDDDDDLSESDDWDQFDSGDLSDLYDDDEERKK